MAVQATAEDGWRDASNLRAGTALVCSRRNRCEHLRGTSVPWLSPLVFLDVLSEAGLVGGHCDLLHCIRPCSPLPRLEGSRGERCPRFLFWAVVSRNWKPNRSDGGARCRRSQNIGGHQPGTTAPAGESLAGSDSPANNSIGKGGQLRTAPSGGPRLQVSRVGCHLLEAKRFFELEFPSFRRPRKGALSRLRLLLVPCTSSHIEDKM